MSTNGVYVSFGSVGLPGCWRVSLGELPFTGLLLLHDTRYVRYNY